MTETAFRTLKMLMDVAWDEEDERYLEERELSGERRGLCLQDLHLLLQLHDVPHLALLGPRRRLPVRQHPDAAIETKNRPRSVSEFSNRNRDG
jgi:hypothetical protein